MKHDNSYKLLFSHPQMVADLIEGFVPEDWVSQVDFSTLEKVNTGYVSDDLREREDDIIWKVRWGKGWLYVYLLLEFQSSVDAYMSVRLLTYVGLLYQDLIRQRQLAENGKLPPVLPLVLYNGKPRWQAATNVTDLIEHVPGGLERYRPSLHYLLLDEGVLDESHQYELRNLAAALFALEKSRTPTQMQETVARLSDWLQAPEQTGLRRSFTVWIKRVLLPGRLPGVTIPQVNDLHEVNTMLAERFKEWTKEWEQQGIQQGMQQGMLQGIQQGMQQGMQQGILQGEIALFKKLFNRRFGPLDESTLARLENATTSDLEQWAEKLLDAQTAKDVFE